MKLVNLSRAAAAAVTLTVASAAVSPLASAGPVAASARTANVNFVGRWLPASGVAWRITSENRGSGACKGRSALAAQGYGFTACKVSGDHYTFTVTYGSGYRSVNRGTIHGNRLSGSFHDTNGTAETYTAVRRK